MSIITSCISERTGLITSAFKDCKAPVKRNSKIRADLVSPSKLTSKTLGSQDHLPKPMLRGRAQVVKEKKALHLESRKLNILESDLLNHGWRIRYGW